MKARPLAFLTALAICAALIAMGCVPKIKDADLVGTWKRDKTPGAAAGKDEKLESQMTFDLQANHKYVMACPFDVTLKGNWVYADHKVTLTPVTMSMVFGTGAPIEEPVADTIKKLADAAHMMGKTDADISDMKSLGEPQELKVDQDGKGMQFEAMHLVKS